MASSVQIVVEAVDRAQGVLRQTEAELGRLAQANSSTGTVFSRVNDVLAEHNKLLLAMKLAAAAVPATLGAMVRGNIAAGDSLQKMSQRTGVSVETLSVFGHAAKMAGLDLGDIELGFRTLARQIMESKDPTSQAGRLFQTLGIQARDTGGNLKSSETVILDVMDAISKLPDGFAKSTVAQELFNRGGQRMIPWLNEGRAGFERMTEETKRAGTYISKDFAADAEQFDRNLKNIREVLSGAGLAVAKELLPPLIELTRFLLDHKDALRNTFLLMAGAITVATTAFTAFKAAILSSKLTQALIGAEAMASLRMASLGLIGIGVQAKTARDALGVMYTVGAAQAVPLLTRLSEIMVQLRLLRVTAAGAFAATALGTGVVIGAGIAVLAATIYAGVEAWKAYKAAKQEALSETDVAESNQTLRRRLETTIQTYRDAGTITEAQAKSMQDRLDKAFTPKVTKTWVSAGTGGRGVEVTTEQHDFAGESRTARQLATELVSIVDLQRARIDLLSQGAITDETTLKLKTDELAVLKAESSFAERQAQAEYDRLDSTVTLEERTRQRWAETQREEAAQIEFINERARLEERIALKEASKGPGMELVLPTIEDQAAKEQFVRAAAANQIAEIESKRDRAIVETQIEFNSQRIKVDEDYFSGAQTREKTDSQKRLTLAQETDQQLLAEEIQIRQKFQQLREQTKNIPAADRQAAVGEINAAEDLATMQARAAVIRNRALAVNDLAAAEKNLALTLAQTEPGPITVRRQEEINRLIRESNALLEEKRRIIQEDITTGRFKKDDELKARKDLLQVEQQIIQNRREMYRQDTWQKQLPSFSGELGYENRLTPQGLPTGERDLVAPWRALDTFLTGTLQATFNGLSDAISGLVTGTRSWVDVWKQVGNEIISMIIRLILEYTIFHAIRMALDSIFHTTARTNITATATAGRAASATSAAATAAEGGTVAAAWAPAAAATGIGSFGASAVIGLVLALAAIAAIVAALAFEAGGIVPGRPSRKDNRLAWVASGEFIIPTVATQRLMALYGPEALEKLRRGELPTRTESKGAQVPVEPTPTAPAEKSKSGTARLGGQAAGLGQAQRWTGPSALPAGVLAAARSPDAARRVPLTILKLLGLPAIGFAQGGVIPDFTSEFIAHSDRLWFSADTVSEHTRDRLSNFEGLRTTTSVASVIHCFTDLVIHSLESAGAYARGGIIPGSPSRTDNRLAAVATGELILSAPATQRLIAGFGPGIVARLLEGAFPGFSEDSRLTSDVSRVSDRAAWSNEQLSRIAESLVTMRVVPVQHFAQGGMVDYLASIADVNDHRSYSTVLARPAQSTDVHVAPAAVNFAVFDDKRKLEEWLRSNSGRKVLLDLIKANKLELGIRS
jgi:hypothetical protein